MRSAERAKSPEGGEELRHALEAAGTLQTTKGARGQRAAAEKERDLLFGHTWCGGGSSTWLSGAGGRRRSAQKVVSLSSGQAATLSAMQGRLSLTELTRRSFRTPDVKLPIQLQLQHGKNGPRSLTVPSLVS